MFILGNIEVFLILSILTIFRIAAYSVQNRNVSPFGKIIMRILGIAFSIFFMIISFFSIVDIIAVFILVILIAFETIAGFKKFPSYIFLIVLFISVLGLLIPKLWSNNSCGSNDGGPNETPPTCSCKGIIVSDFNEHYCIGKLL